ncbi:EAL domain-containing protein [Chthonobacter albigriseus]|uniref:EAL domain-containing protein n=1 Tax=Chthonobacter albigriseus TaxID=1683161 RepID=UPI0015EEDD2D|nr:EAL domain-containing protein [Chthonobacter albigriseus]
MSVATGQGVSARDDWLAVVLENTSCAVFQLDRDAIIRDLRAPQRASVLGIRPGESWFDLFAPSALADLRAAFARALTGEPAEVEAPLSAGDGAVVLRAALSPASVAGRDAAVLAVVRNVTEEHRLRACLAEQSRLHQALLQAVSDIVWHYDVRGGTSERHGWAAYTGCDLDPGDPYAWLDVVHPDDRDAVADAVRRAAAAGMPYAVEHRLRRASGDWRWVENRAVPLRDAAGAITDWIGLVSEVHSRRAAEHARGESEDRLRLAIEATGLGIWDVDLRTGERNWSDELKRMLGLAPDLLPTEGLLLERVHPDDRADVARHNRTTLLQADGTPSVTFRIIRADTGETRWIRSQGRVVTAPDGEPLRRIGTFRDITEQHQTRQALDRALRRYEALISATSEIVWQADATQEVSEGIGWMEFTGQRPDDAGGAAWLASVHRDDRARARETCTQAMQACLPYINEYRLFHAASGGWRWVVDRAVPLLDAAGQVTEWVGIISDIHDRKTAEERITRAAHTDALTGLANRSLFQARLDGAIAAAGAESHIVGLLLIDLDRFKEVNDSLGHDAGDALLCEVAARLERVCGDAATIARLGGDEFGVIVEARRRDDVERTAAALLTALKTPFTHAGLEIGCAATIGFAIHPTADEVPAELLKNADIALYAAKSAGRGQAFEFASGMRDELNRRVAVLRRAKDVLARSAVVPFYQPKVSLVDGRLMGFEALLRWSDGTRLCGPGDILAAFHDHELAPRFGAAMLAAVVADMRGWTAADLAFGHVALNAAAPEFMVPGFADTLLATLRAAGLPPGALELEVTETVLLENGTDRVEAALRQLHAAGIVIALDDFGTGYSSLTHLRRFPVSRLKIDRSFVASLGVDRDAGAIVEAVLGLARSLGLSVVAEGVETLAQALFLGERGCGEAQGFLLARPMAASRVPHFVESWDTLRAERLPWTAPVPRPARLGDRRV